MVRKIPFRGLEAFEAVARLGSFTAAAAELGVSRSALSHLVAGLEDKLGVALLVRAVPGVTVSNEGTKLQQHLRDGFATIQAAVEEAVQAGMRQTISLSAPPFFANRFLRGDFGTEMPRRFNVALRVDIENRYAAVERGTSSCAVRFGRGDWPGLRSELLLRVRFTPVCAPSLLDSPSGAHPLEQATRLAFAGEVDGWDRFDAQLGLDHEAARVRRFDSFVAAWQECLDGGGVMLAPVELIGTELAAGKLERLSGIDLPSRDAFYFVAQPALFNQPHIVALRRIIARRVASIRANGER